MNLPISTTEAHSAVISSSILVVFYRLFTAIFYIHSHFTFVIAFVFIICVYFLWRCGPIRSRASSFLRFLDHTQRRTTVGRTPLDKGSARRTDLYLTTHNTHSRQTSMPSAGFEPTIPADERPQTYAFDRAATGSDIQTGYGEQFYLSSNTLYIISFQ